MSRSLFMSLLFSVIFLFPAEAQILNRIMKEAKRDVQRNVENMVVEKATEAIVRAAMRPIEESFDQMLKESYKEDSTRRANEPAYADTSSFDYDSFMGFLSEMNKSVELPESYDFNLSMDVLIEQEDESNSFTWHFSPSGDHIAMEQGEEKGKKTIILMDFKRDVNVLYSVDKNGKKTGQAIPSMHKLMLSMAASDQEDMEEDEYRIRKTGKHKTIAGYRCAEYKGENKEQNLLFYATPEFPVNWNKSYADMIAQYAPENARGEYQKIEGMVLESILTDKEEPKETIRMTTTRVEEKAWTLHNAEYEMKGQSK